MSDDKQPDSNAPEPMPLPSHAKKPTSRIVEATEEYKGQAFIITGAPKPRPKNQAK